LQFWESQWCNSTAGTYSRGFPPSGGGAGQRKGGSDDGNHREAQSGHGLEGLLQLPRGGSGLFFPERGASTREAKEVCRSCVVQNDCLEYALQNGEKFGIWGGMSERERRRIRRQRALERQAAERAAEAV